MRDLNIAYGNSCMAKKWSNKTITWEALKERLKTTIRTSESVEEYHKMKRGEKEGIKDKGGFVGGQLKEGRRKREGNRRKTARERKETAELSLPLSRHLKSKCFIKLQSQLLVWPEV